MRRISFPKPPYPTTAAPTAPIIGQAVRRCKARLYASGGQAHQGDGPVMDFALRGLFLNAKIAGFDLVIGAQFFGLCRINHLALAHDVHIIDQLERKVRILLDQQDGKTFLL